MSNDSYKLQPVRAIPIFTPGLLGPDILRTIFVARQPLLKRLSDDIRTAANSGKSLKTRNNLLIAGRGGGKSTLVTLTYHDLREDLEVYPKLCIALLREDEDDITSWSAMLVRIFRALALEYPLERNRLNALADRLRRLPIAESETEGQAALRDFIGNRCFVVLVENLEYIFDSILDDEGKEGLIRLHRFLIETHSVVLATAPSFNLTDYPQFSDYFTIEHLEELTPEQARDLLARIAETVDNNVELVQYLQTPEAINRLRVIRELAGGYPRIWIIFSDTISLSRLEQLVPLFLNLLDHLVPLYQERMRALPSQERRIVTFLRDAGGAVPVKEIAEACRLAPNACAALLGKLSNKSYVQKAELEIVSKGDGRTSFYELREPLMRFCLQAKENRFEPLRLIVEFLRLWFAEEEIQARLEALSPDEAPVTRQYLSAALSRLREDKANTIFHTRVDSEIPPEKRLQDSEQAINIDPTDAVAWNNLGLAQSDLKQYDEAIVSFDKAIEINPSYADAWSNRGLAQSDLKEHDKAIVSFEKVIEIDSNYAYAWGNLGNALSHLKRYEEAITSFDKVIKFDPRFALVWNNRGNVLSDLKRYDEAVDSYNKAIEINPNDAYPWYARGKALSYLKRQEESNDCRQIYLSIYSGSRHVSLSAAHSLTCHHDKAFDELRLTVNEEREQEEGIQAATAFFLRSLIVNSVKASRLQEQATVLTELFDEIDLLPRLSEALMRTLRDIFYDSVTNKMATDWQAAWAEATYSRPEMDIARRLLRAAVLWKRTCDRGALLRLPAEERSVLEGILKEIPEL